VYFAQFSITLDGASRRRRWRWRNSDFCSSRLDRCCASWRHCTSQVPITVASGVTLTSGVLQYWPTGVSIQHHGLIEVDSCGNLTQRPDPLNRSTNYTYDAMDRALTETDTRHGLTQFGYDALGRLITVTDPTLTCNCSKPDAFMERILSPVAFTLQFTSPELSKATPFCWFPVFTVPTKASLNFQGMTRVDQVLLRFAEPSASR
jgi:YD repeat-containing protein